MPLLLNFAIELRLIRVIIDYRMLKIIASVFIAVIVTERLEKHAILKFRCSKLLGHCNKCTFLSFFVFFYFIIFVYIS